MYPSVAMRKRKLDETPTPSVDQLRRSSRLAKKAARPTSANSILNEDDARMLLEYLPTMEKLKASCVYTRWRQLINRLPIIQRLDVAFCTPVSMIQGRLHPNSLQDYGKHLHAMTSAQ